MDSKLLLTDKFGREIFLMLFTVKISHVFMTLYLPWSSELYAVSHHRGVIRRVIRED